MVLGLIGRENLRSHTSDVELDIKLSHDLETVILGGGLLACLYIKQQRRIRVKYLYIPNEIVHYIPKNTNSLLLVHVHEILQ